MKIQKTKNFRLLAFGLFVSLQFSLCAGEQFEFMKSMIQSLEVCETALDSFNKNTSDDLILTMKNIALFNSGIAQSSGCLSGYTNSNSEVIKETAETLAILYKGIIKVNLDHSQMIEDLMNSPEKFESAPGTFARNLSEQSAREEQLWKTFPQVTIFSCHILVDKNRVDKDGKLQFLNITRKERDALLLELSRFFGDRIKEGGKAGMLPLEFSIASLYEFLSNSKWASSDSE